MDRRQFLKTLGIAVAAAQLTPGTLFGGTGWDKKKKYPEFDPKQEYGGSVDVRSSCFDKSLAKESVAVMDEQIEATIPLNYRHKIKYAFVNAVPRREDPLAQRSVATWKYSPKHTRTEMWHE